MRHALTFCLMLSLSALPALREGHAQEASGDAAIAQASDQPSVTATVSGEGSSQVSDASETNSAQTETTDPKAGTANVPISPILTPQTQNERLAAPDVYLLPDKKGKLRKVLGFRYEDFFDAWRRGDGGKVLTPPRYVVDSWSVTAEATLSNVNAVIRFEIKTEATGWIDIPIQLPELILQKVRIGNQKAGECLVFDQQRHGYVLWLRGDVAANRSVEVGGIVKLSRGNGSQSLQMHLPRSVTSSFVATVPVSTARFEASPELTMETLEGEDGSTEVRLRGQANPLQLTWSVDSATATDDRTAIAVETETLAHVDRRNVAYDATLRVDSFGRPIDRLRVRLPHGSTLKKPTPGTKYQIRQIDTSGDQDQHQEVEVRLLEPTTEPFSVKLVAERAIESFGDTTECRLGGFDVLDAFQQSGTITLHVSDQLQAYFDLYGEIEQIPFDDSAVTPEDRFALGRFRYARFPWQVVVFTSPRQRRVSVQPDYELTIDAETARLSVAYDYQLTGARMFSLRLDLHGWELTDDPIDAGGAVDLTRIVERHEGVLILPLVDENRQQFSVNLELERSTQLGENILPLPEPLDAFVVEGELAVDAPESVQVSPQPSRMIGLGAIATASSPDADASATESAGDGLRLHTFLPQPTFAAEISRRPLDLTAELNASAEVSVWQTRVRQQILYQAKYQSVSRLVLQVPDALWSNDSLKLSFEGEELPLTLNAGADDDAALPADEDREDVRGLREVVVSLPRAMQNEIAIDVEYEIATPELVVAELIAFSLPLVTPVEIPVRQTVVVSPTEPVLTTLNQRSGAEEWKVETRDSTTENAARGLTVTASGRPAFLSLFAQLDSVDRRQLATLDRAWIQSWIAFGQRQQRAVFRFRTPHDRVTVQLPEVLDSATFEVILDGEPSTYRHLADSRLELALDQPHSTQAHTLEVRYQSTATLADISNIRCEFPRLECRIASAPIYWQLILPQGWQTLQAPDSLLPDYWLGWRHFRWGRQPTLSQGDLEQITGAVPTMPPAPLSTQYIYRAFEFPTEIHVTAVRQLWIFSFLAIGVFLLGLLSLYTSIARSGLFWLGLSLLLLLGIFSHPEITLLVIEVILAGGTMTLAAVVLKRIFVPQRLSSMEGLSSPSAASDATEPWQQRIGDGHSITETTATLKTGGQTL